ncbi:unnamed protein product [Clonostachys rhizophaga]|uniref:Short-chain dehydrogenases/reductase n=1 Tax=Clonostachys rhizophaga TaxID=160324 RepID=A0A9N9V8F0_9HYPO|nr:unnamed protein product [Clonostachys rhizophaga]
MVSLSSVSASNSLIPKVIPAGLVAVFFGGTSGIGEITVKTLAKYARSPRIYIVGRSQDAADRILTECKAINPDGEFIFMKADVSLIRNVDELSNEIKAKEKFLNLLFLTAGVANIDRAQTSEHLHLLAALNYYCRVRFIQNLLPLVQQAPGLRRVVAVGGGGHEGNLDPNDFQALRVPVPDLREYLTTLVTLGLENVARGAPEVSIVHNYPGTVKTPLLDSMPDEVLRTLTFLPLEECGERQVFMATSAKYPPVSGQNAGITMVDGINVAISTTGEEGRGVYSVGVDCESASPAVREKLAGLRDRGMLDEVWRHTQGEFERIMEDGSRA